MKSSCIVSEPQTTLGTFKISICVYQGHKISQKLDFLLQACYDNCTFPSSLSHNPDASTSPVTPTLAMNRIDQRHMGPRWAEKNPGRVCASKLLPFSRENPTQVIVNLPVRLPVLSKMKGRACNSYCPTQWASHFLREGSVVCRFFLLLQSWRVTFGNFGKCFTRCSRDPPVW